MARLVQGAALTTGEQRFEVAISFAAKDEWIARDLHDLLVGSGIATFSYSRCADEARGVLRDNLSKIYENSSLNVLLWSQHYAKASTDSTSFVAMERRVIVHRHVYKGEAESLVVATIDDEPIPRDFEIMLVHDICTTAILGLEGIVRERIRELGRRPTPFGTVFHPVPTDKYRGPLHPCDFTLSSRFASDALGRWTKLADVLVDLRTDHGTKYVYLIPSGLADVMVRHTKRFLTDPLLIETKRRITARFVDEVGDRTLSGFWFLSQSPRAPEADIVVVYCGEYDRYLNTQFDIELARVRRERNGR